MDAIWWVMAHPDTSLAILGAIHAAAVLIVNATPTPRDDALLGKVYKVVEKLAGVITTASKEFPGERESNKQAGVRK